MLFDESIDVDNTMTNGGGGINPDVLPRNGSNGCTPVYPWQYPRVNNIFEVNERQHEPYSMKPTSWGHYTFVLVQSGHIPTSEFAVGSVNAKSIFVYLQQTFCFHYRVLWTTTCPALP